MGGASAGQDATMLQLADALCARLCHDLSGPLGTLTGALDLAAEDASYVAEALPLASETALAMTARIRLLRAAWAGDCGCLSNQDLIALAMGLPSRVRLDASQLASGPFSAAVSRILVNLMLLAAEALPRGGTVRLIGETDLVVAVDGPGAAWPDALLTAITDPADVPLDDPRAVQAPVAAMLVRAAGLRLSLLLAAGSFAAGVPPILLAP